MIHQISYVSTPAPGLKLASIQAVLARARARNAAHSVTGFLAYRSDWFLQVIEGDEAAVRFIFEGIRDSPLHREVAVLSSESVPSRAFRSFDMGFLSFARAVDAPPIPFALAPEFTPRALERSHVVPFMQAIASRTKFTRDLKLATGG